MHKLAKKNSINDAHKAARHTEVLQLLLMQWSLP